ncbi:MAG: glycosyltransferase family 2 protein [Opitutae bacterium]|jgi:glycosyltransferase involved in cell wall biosynthesis|nr:glycosyltransferase family 2 protein [Opitutae bacterium]
MSDLLLEISVLISTYNDRDLVDKKLREIVAQTAFSRSEFIFVEPASPGNERELLEPFCEQYENCRLITLEERIGLYRAWNLGWQAASAPLVCISNMDDAMHPELLEQVIEGMARNAWDVATVLIAKQSVDAEWNSWEVSRLRKLDLSMRPGAFFAWRNDLCDELGMFDKDLKIVGDKEFWARVGHLKLKVGLIPEVLYLYTKHSGQLSKRTEFRVRKLAEKQSCLKLGYRYDWPVSLRRRIRWIRWKSHLPFSKSVYRPTKGVSSGDEA